MYRIVCAYTCVQMTSLSACIGLSNLNADGHPRTPRSNSSGSQAQSSQEAEDPSHVEDRGQTEEAQLEDAGPDEA